MNRYDGDLHPFHGGPNPTPAYAAARTVDFSDIPVIDLSDIDQPDGHRRIAAELVDTASRIGFFYVSGHGVSPELRAEAMAASRAFFALDEAVKSQIAIDSHQRGWMAQGLANLEGSKTHDAKEVFFWGREVADDDPDVVAGLPLVHPNSGRAGRPPFSRWHPSLLPGRHGAWQADPDLPCRRAGDHSGLWRGPMSARWDAASLSIIRRLARMMSRRTACAAEHSDFGVLTILQQDNLGGLQVRNQSGDWIEAMPIENTFVCNIGDLLERWTNGRLVSTPHRVLNRSGKSRFSIPIFCDPASDAVIDPRDFDPKADLDGFRRSRQGVYRRQEKTEIQPL